jgi:hypothetical protein
MPVRRIVFFVVLTKLLLSIKNSRPTGGKPVENYLTVLVYQILAGSVVETAAPCRCLYLRANQGPGMVTV